MADITDGTTNTAMLSELILTPDNGAHDLRGRYYNPPEGNVLFSTLCPPNTPVPDAFLGATTLIRFLKAPCIWPTDNFVISARSWHPGGVNLAMADGFGPLRLELGVSPDISGLGQP